jgi:hypothetical protein
MEHTITLVESEIVVGDVEGTDLFEVKFPSTAVVRDEINDRVSTPPDAQRGPAGSQTNRWLITLNVLAVLVVAVGYLVSRRWRTRAAADSPPTP